MNFKILKEMVAEYNKNSRITNNVISVFHTKYKHKNKLYVTVQLRNVESEKVLTDFSVENDGLSTYSNLKDKASKGLINDIVFHSLNALCQKKIS